MFLHTAITVGAGDKVDAVRILIYIILISRLFFSIIEIGDIDTISVA